MDLLELTTMTYWKHSPVVNEYALQWECLGTKLIYADDIVIDSP